jgi:hypothetical protein
MIFFGTRVTQVATEKIAYECPNCGTKNSVQMFVFQKFAHVFWIPMFPMSKTVVTECSHCKQVLRKEEFPPRFRDSYEILKSKSKTPIWTFSGLVLFAIFLVVGGIRSNQNKERNAELILSPQKGDVYEIKLDYKQYTLYKVDEVVGDTVFVLPHQYEINKRSGIKDLKMRGDDDFVLERFPILKEELKIKLEEGEIMNVDRK